MRIGILGGTFDPIHYGHLRLSEYISQIFNFNELLFVPAYCPPHKSRLEITPAYFRYTMSILATISIPYITVSTVELFHPEAPYSYQTAKAIRKYYGPEAHLFFLMGADQFNSLTSWHRYETLVDLCHLIVMARPNCKIKIPKHPREIFGHEKILDLRDTNLEKGIPSSLLVGGTRIFIINGKEIDISSTQVRLERGKGKSITEYVPELVADYIQKYKLYLLHNPISSNKENT